MHLKEKCAKKLNMQMFILQHKKLVLILINLNDMKIFILSILKKFKYQIFNFFIKSHKAILIYDKIIIVDFFAIA